MIDTNEEIKNGLLALHEIDMAIVEIQQTINKLQRHSHIIQRTLLNSRTEEIQK